MAILKEITQPDGVVTDYHRILYLQTTVNCQNSIAVLSYVSTDLREREKEDGDRPYVQSTTYETDYDPDMTIEEAYGYLKTLEEFKGAIDI